MSYEPETKDCFRKDWEEGYNLPAIFQTVFSLPHRRIVHKGNIFWESAGMLS
jgi:hypothetical protein